MNIGLMIKQVSAIFITTSIIILNWIGHRNLNYIMIWHVKYNLIKNKDKMSSFSKVKRIRFNNMILF
jgi:hypothetical protein